MINNIKNLSSSFIENPPGLFEWMVIGLIIIILILPIYLCIVIAKKHKMSWAMGFILGLLLSWIGLIIILLMVTYRKLTSRQKVA